MKASDLFVKALENEGVKYIFALPGEENLDLLESLRKASIKVIITRHEQAAAFMAATYGRLTGKAGVCLATLGPGALNLITGVAFAQLAGTPLIAITGQKAIRYNLQGQFQLIDTVSTFKPITKLATSITDGRQIPKVIRQVFKLAETEKPGAIHIELPEDVAKDKVKTPILKRTSLRRPSVDKKALNKAIKLIIKSKRPIILIGSGGNRKRINNELNYLIDATGFYVVHTQMGKGVFSDRDSHSLFTIGIHRQDFTHCGLNKADLIITIGYNTVEYPPSVWNPKGNKEIIHIDFTQSITEQHYNPAIELIGDIADTLCKLSEYLSPNKMKWDLEYFARLRNLLVKKHKEKTNDSSFPLKPQRIIADTRKVLADNDILLLDNGIYKLWVARQYSAYAPNTVILDNALASMGQGLPNGIAAKLLNKNKNVLVFAGDGGFMMNSQELETAVRLDLNVVTLIWRDDAYGFIRFKQESMGFDDFAMEYTNPDFVKYAQSYGAKGYRINKAQHLIPTIKKAFKQKGPVIIDCPVDYSQNQKVFSKELGELVCPV